MFDFIVIHFHISVRRPCGASRTISEVQIISVTCRLCHFNTLQNLSRLHYKKENRLFPLARGEANSKSVTYVGLRQSTELAERLLSS
jgi:hypothetical protein